MTLYSTNYYAYDVQHVRASPVHTITDGSHPIDAGFLIERSDWFEMRHHDGALGRLSGVWWKTHPWLAVPDAAVTIWIGANFDVLIPDLAERCIAELGDDDAVFMRHPWRDDLEEEERDSHPNPKYDGQDTAGQVASYLEAGHPVDWGLAHGGFLVRRDNARTRAFGEAWWAEIARWSVQDQLSLPYCIRTSEMRWHWWPSEGHQGRAKPFGERWIRYGGFGA